MSEPTTTSRGLLLAIAIAFGLVFAGALAGRVWLGSWIGRSKERVEESLRLDREDREKSDAARARFIARAGAARALVEVKLGLRAGLAAQGPFDGTLGRTYSRGGDRYKASIEASGATYRVRSRGELLLDESRSAATATFTVTAKVTADAIEVLASRTE